MKLEEKAKSIKIALLYNTFNILLFCVILRQSFVINSDGPSGFGEFVLKGLMFFISIFTLFLGFVLSIVGVLLKRESKWQNFIVFLCICSAFILILFAGIHIIDACSNDNGYCRHGALYFQ